jgi:hypothetical protein
MTIHYTVLNYAPEWMIHNDRRNTYETKCDGCGSVLDSSFVTIITDRSGSEYSVTYMDDDDCIRRAVGKLTPGG